MPTPRNVIFFATPDELRAWFEANHESASELWLGYHKKSTGRPSVTWQEVVDQELCFGWIDSVRDPLDDGRSAQRITPRRKGSVWSAINIKRYEELENLGLVHASGRAAFERRLEARSRIYSYENRLVGFDASTEAEFARHARAWKFFQTQPPSYRRTAAFLVMSAKRDETRRRRLEKLIEHSNKGERLPALSPRRSPPRAS